tara:strand:- start:219 stop:392 length:174 start_codon:yes stop_codon:yes gene_type:complete
MSEDEQIEEILEEANAHNLRNEVKKTAESLYGKINTQFHVFSRIDAYVKSYHQWIKE